jgi:hypothetical protein
MAAAGRETGRFAYRVTVKDEATRLPSSVGVSFVPAGAVGVEAVAERDHPVGGLHVGHAGRHADSGAFEVVVVVPPPGR